MNEVPIIDLCAVERVIVPQIKEACHEYGFFYIQNHGIENLNEVFASSSDFFSLPLEEKIKSICNSDNLGYTTFGDETLDLEKQSCGDTKEGYYIEAEKDPDRNVWPMAIVCGSDWKRMMLSYHNKLCQLGNRIVNLIALSAGLPENYFSSFFESPTALLRLLHYSPQVSLPEEGIFAAGAHTDYGFLTILATDSQPGLQIFLKDQWIDVPPCPNTFIINLGDMLQRWTNNAFKSTIHRVVNVTGENRFSIAFFYEPNGETIVEPLSTFVSADFPIQYSPIKYSDYLAYRYSLSHTDYKEKIDM